MRSTKYKNCRAGDKPAELFLCEWKGMYECIQHVSYPGVRHKRRTDCTGAECSCAPYCQAVGGAWYPYESLEV